MIIRAEVNADENRIRELTRKAFEGKPFSDGSEPRIIDDLRKDGDLSLSLVALDDRGIQAHIAFSPVTINGQSGWYGLGPVSVEPALQKQGWGSGIINEGLARIKALNAKGCVLIGDPNYYRRFGFKGNSGLIYGDVPADYVQQLPFGDMPASGHIRYAPAFSVTDEQP